MQPAPTAVWILRTSLMAAALLLRPVGFSGPALAQGPEPFGQPPEGSFGGPYYGVVPAAPVAPQASARPSSWPGSPAKQTVRPAAAAEPVSDADRDPGFSFAEDHGGPPRRPRKPQPSPGAPPPVNAPPPINVSPPINVQPPANPQPPALPGGNPQPPVSAQPAADRPTTVLLPQLGPAPSSAAGPAASAAGAIEPIRTSPPLQNPYSLDVRARPAPALQNPYSLEPRNGPGWPPVVAGAAVAPAAESSPVVLTPSEPLRVGPPTNPQPPALPGGNPQPPVNQPPVSAQPTAVLLPQLGPAPSSAAGPAAPAAGTIEPIRTSPPLQNPYSLDVRARPAPALQNPYSLEPRNAPGWPPVVAGAAVAPAAESSPVVLTPSEPLRVGPAAELSTGRLQNPYQAGLPGDRRLLSDRLSSGLRAYRSGPPVRPAAEGSAAAPPSGAVSPAGMIQNPHVSPAGEAFISDEATPGPATPSKASPPVQPASQNAPAADPKAQSLRAPASADRSAAAVLPGPSWMSVNPGIGAYKVESRSMDAAAGPSGPVAFPLEMPGAQATTATVPGPEKPAGSNGREGFLMAQSVPAQAAALPGAGTGAAPDREQGMTPCENAQILARVGSDVILAADLAGPVNEVLLLNKDKIPPEQVDLARQQLTRRMLDGRIETKLACLDARRQLPAETVTRIEKNIGDAFDKEEIEKLMKRAQAGSRQELDAKLQGLGSSLENKRRAFVEQIMAQQWIRQKIKIDGEVSHEQMLAFYHDHITDFETPAQARWEELEVRFSRHPRKEEAYGLIVQLGNRVVGGAPFAEVAKAGSEGITAAAGGQREWTSRGSLVSAEIDQALFGLPVGALGQIIETKTSFNIIRVVERKETVRKPFTEAQVDIRKKIKDLRTDTQIKAYLDQLRKDVPVWTVFDDPSGKGSRTARG